MDRGLYWLALAIIKGLQTLPLRWVGWLGRRGGDLAYWLDRRHRRVASENLARCLGNEKSSSELRAIAHEHFRRLGENYASAIKTASMDWESLKRHVQFVHLDRMQVLGAGTLQRSCIVAIGHFGNFELYARFTEMLPGVRCATTYRALKQPRLNQLLQSMRERSGCLFFERRTEAAALRAALDGDKPLFLGLLADQHAGQRGIAAPFFGRECSTSPAPALLALRYHCPLFTGICYRVGLAQWRIEAGAEIPTHEHGRPRSIEAITADMNCALEAAVRQDPANWFWVHNRWKSFRSRTGRSPAHPASDQEGEAGKILPVI
jgi:lauroyl/myristoyl acyltransferase